MRAPPPCAALAAMSFRRNPSPCQLLPSVTKVPPDELHARAPWCGLTSVHKDDRTASYDRPLPAGPTRPAEPP